VIALLEPWNQNRLITAELMTGEIVSGSVTEIERIRPYLQGRACRRSVSFVKIRTLVNEITGEQFEVHAPNFLPP